MQGAEANEVPGNWYMRDDRAQAAGSFPASKGSPLKHEKLIDFIQRNHAPDDQGRWFFQNGPQCVFVDLDDTPWVACSPMAACSHTPGSRPKRKRKWPASWARLAICA